VRGKAEWHIENEGDVFVSLKFIYAHLTS